MGVRLSIFSSRPLAFAGVLALALIALDHVIAWGLGRTVGQSNFRYAQVFEGQVDAEVAILGNSRAVHALYAPELSRDWCRPVANLAYNGMPMMAQELVLQGLIDGPTPPDVVVLEVTAALSPAENARQLSTFAGASRNLRTRLAQDRGSVLPWSSLFGTLRYNNDLLFRSLFYLRRGDQTWINRRGPVSAQSVIAARQNAPRSFAITPGARESLQRMIRMAADHDIEMVMFLAPYHTAILQTAPDAMTWADALGLPQDGYANLSDAITGDAAFTDTLHTNIEGARLIAAALRARYPALASCGD